MHSRIFPWAHGIFVIAGAFMLLQCQSTTTPNRTGSQKQATAMKEELETITIADTLTVSSPAFEHLGFIPARYTCDGANVNPPLDINHIPDGAQSLALIVDDPDAPAGTWDHWIVWNIDPEPLIAENTVPGIEGTNDFGRRHYGGPCPPSGTHRYFFNVYALDNRLELPAGAGRSEVEHAMAGHVLAKGELVGRYRRE